MDIGIVYGVLCGVFGDLSRDLGRKKNALIMDYVIVDSLGQTARADASRPVTQAKGMELACIGLNYQTAPVEVRERFAVSKAELGQRSLQLSQMNGIQEIVVLSTCNRTEYYVVADCAEDAFEQITSTFMEACADVLDPEHHLYRCSGLETVRHLYRVCAGLDSMVLGETEIFGQVKEAYRQAMGFGVTSKGLNKLFQRAFGVGKKVRTQTKIQEGNISTGSVAVDMAQRIFGKLRDTEVLLLGAGEISRVTAQSLRSRGAKSIHVANRSFDKAAEMAAEFGGKAMRFDAWEAALQDVDVIISSTGAPHYILLADQIEKVRRQRKYRPLFLIDLAVPRDIDPQCREIEEVYLFDIDSLEAQAAENRASRQREIEKCEQIIEEDLEKCNLPGV